MTSIVHVGAYGNTTIVLSAILAEIIADQDEGRLGSG